MSVPFAQSTAAFAKPRIFRRARLSGVDIEAPPLPLPGPALPAWRLASDCIGPIEPRLCLEHCIGYGHCPDSLIAPVRGHQGAV